MKFSPFVLTFNTQNEKNFVLRYNTRNNILLKIKGTHFLVLIGDLFSESFLRGSHLYIP